MLNKQGGGEKQFSGKNRLQEELVSDGYFNEESYSISDFSLSRAEVHSDVDVEEVKEERMKQETIQYEENELEKQDGVNQNENELQSNQSPIE